MTEASSRTESTTPVHRVVGALLLLPALILWLVQLVLPTIGTVITSLRRANPFRDGGGGEFVGATNYAEMLELALPALPRTLIFAGPTILITIVVGLLIGGLAGRGSRPARMITRGILGLGLVLFAPVGVVMAGSWRELLGAGPGLAVTLAVTAGYLTLAGSAAALAWLAAFRSASPLPTAAAVTGIVLAVGLGLAVQLYATPMVLTAGGPNHETETPVLLISQFGFSRADYGPGSAVAVLVGIVAAVLGLVTVLIILSTRLRIEIEPPRQPGRGSALGWLGVAAAGLFLLIMIIVLAGWLIASVRPWPANFSPMILVNTWVPPLVGALVQLAVAIAAGFGLGYLRPLGRSSEWALLIFAPWLLIGPGVGMLQHFIFLREAGLIGTLLGFLPSTMISVAAVVGFTLLFAGVRRLRDSGAPSGAAIVPVLGVALTSLGLLWVVQAQSLVIGMINGNRADAMTGPIALLTAAAQSRTRMEDVPHSLNTPLPLIILLGLASIAVQALCLDRLRLATGSATAQPAPAPSATH